ncbi:MAG: lysine 2,3-aminomutase [Desulfobulbaceae bacterium DB1]|nr:MAG: lysine 2,3-aminomutase [Desulfobulbaceae bacterium DB1]
MYSCPAKKVVSSEEAARYTSYSLSNFHKIRQIHRLTRQQRFAVDVVGRVLPFKTNSYVVNNLINWDNVPNDPVFILNFPQEEMLLPHHFAQMASLVQNGAAQKEISACSNKIRLELNPHAAGQLEHNRPSLNGRVLQGMQHKYKETVLCFPSQGQTCHAYCTFCFRWPQFVGIDELRFAMREADDLVRYVATHPEVTDVIFTGGDPLVMRAGVLSSYLRALINADLPHLRTIRIGTKTLSYWPQRYVCDKDAGELLGLFEEVVAAGKHLAIMAHFNVPQELETDIARQAISHIRSTGAQIRTQSPLLRHINDTPESWMRLWKEQVNLGCIPYYMFVARDTGAHHYFGLPLHRAWRIFRTAYKQVSGIARTVRGPSMSALPGKIQILGVADISDEKVFVLQMLQGRNPDWVARPFFAAYDERATWLDELRPACGEETFFFERDSDYPQGNRLHLV